MWLLWDIICGFCGTGYVASVGQDMWLLWDRICGFCGTGYVASVGLAKII
jgi:Ni,Fe-hydrogenase I large subunit